MIDIVVLPSALLASECDEIALAIAEATNSDPDVVLEKLISYATSLGIHVGSQASVRRHELQVGQIVVIEPEALLRERVFAEGEHFHSFMIAVRDNRSYSLSGPDDTAPAKKKGSDGVATVEKIPEAPGNTFTATKESAVTLALA